MENIIQLISKYLPLTEVEDLDLSRMQEAFPQMMFKGKLFYVDGTNIEMQIINTTTSLDNNYDQVGFRLCINDNNNGIKYTSGYSEFSIEKIDDKLLNNFLEKIENKEIKGILSNIVRCQKIETIKSII